ncbi:MAG: NAD(P)(+) transhydrogenase (Re/Si-specific) subunit beta, partial [Rhodospirillales bacterium]|nr:NAD(P)(+) transhydrogenase (Re/Si-specific) subunit beta [Rhodospirillales bacterium]
MSTQWEALLYLLSGALFILAIRSLSSPESARRGNLMAATGMTIAIIVVLIDVSGALDALTIGLIAGGLGLGGGIGALIAYRVKMTDMPQTVGVLNSLGGMAAVLVAAAAYFSPVAFSIGEPGNIHVSSLFETSLGIIIDAITFSGSIVAFTKLQGLVSGAPTVFPLQHPLNATLALVLTGLVIAFCTTQSLETLLALTAVAFLLGVLVILPIGGADMPVVISMLNAYSGWAGAGVGFTLGNTALIITGALVGSSGAILSYIMCKAMNRPFLNVIMGGFGGETGGDAAGIIEDRPVKRGSAEDAAFIMKNAESIIVVPGYGMAVAQAQHAVEEMSELLKEVDVSVKFAIHPVAGRMPGHMNVLLAEAGVSYDDVFDLESINSEFARTNIAIVIG